MSGQKQQLSKCFKPINSSFSVVHFYTFEETCMLLEWPFHAEFVRTPYNEVLISYDCIIVILITIGMCKKLLYCFSCYLAL